MNSRAIAVEFEVRLPLKQFIEVDCTKEKRKYCDGYQSKPIRLFTLPNPLIEFVYRITHTDTKCTLKIYKVSQELTSVVTRDE